MTNQLDTRFYFSGVIDYDGECQQVSDGEAQFWTVYERGDDGLSAAICDCYHRDDAVAATERLNTLIAVLEQSQSKIHQITAERDALREQEMTKASSTRAAADIYFQLVEECEIPPGGSLVQHIDGMSKRIAELEASKLAVKLPPDVVVRLPEILRTGKANRWEIQSMAKVFRSIRAAGGTVQGGE